MNLSLGMCVCRPMRLGPAGDGGGTGTLPWLPDGATTFIDPQDSHFYTNGAETTAAAVFNVTTAITAGTGLELKRNETVAPLLIGDAYTDLAQDSGTLVFDLIVPPFFGGVVITANNADDSNEKWEFDIDSTSAEMVHYNDADWGGASTSTGVLSGFNRVAVSYSPSLVSISINGEAVVTDATAVVGAAVTEVVVGSYDNVDPVSNSATVLSITRYDLKADAALPGLSALPAGLPVFTAQPTLSSSGNIGSVTSGDTLTCDPGTFSGDATITTAFEWSYYGQNDVIGTGASYIVQAADVGKAIVCSVLISNAVGGNISQVATPGTVLA